ncbi:MAG: hypothetical protein FJ086_18290 [Deltaproteobacteria bacterium]|nr:hypothetical protein [Deltaproteobacteria bacterium]
MDRVTLAGALRDFGPGSDEVRDARWALAISPMEAGELGESESRAHGGDLELVQREGPGASFRLWLPQVRERAQVSTVPAALSTEVSA